jgi:hypothetical protein
MSDQPQRAFSTQFKERVVLRLEAGERTKSAMRLWLNFAAWAIVAQGCSVL